MKDKAIILLTGGVSGGHATPTLSVFFTLKNDNHMLRKFDNISFNYFGREEGLEKDVFERLVDKYYSIPASKFRSHFSWKNFSDLLQLPSAFSIALVGILDVKKRAKVDNTKLVLFSSGGYIALPVVLAAWLCRIPCVIHEQTSRAGLANKITSFFAKRILISFEASYPFFPKKKTYFTGYPFLKKTRIILGNSAKISKSDETFSLPIPPKKKFLLVMGGSAGSEFVNTLIKKQMAVLNDNYFVFHQVGRGNLSNYLSLRSDNYFPVGFVSGEEWITLLKKADIIVARSGAGTVSECIYLNKKVIFIPLKISRNDEQFFNAIEASKYTQCRILREEEFSGEEGSSLLVSAIDELQKQTNSKTEKGKKQAWEIFKHRTENAAITIASHVKHFIMPEENTRGAVPRNKNKTPAFIKKQNRPKKKHGSYGTDVKKHPTAADRSKRRASWD